MSGTVLPMKNNQLLLSLRIPTTELFLAVYNSSVICTVFGKGSFNQY